MEIYIYKYIQIWGKTYLIMWSIYPKVDNLNKIYHLNFKLEKNDQKSITKNK